jgi:hypothetical protein
MPLHSVQDDNGTLARLGYQDLLPHLQRRHCTSRSKLATSSVRFVKIEWYDHRQDKSAEVTSLCQDFVENYKFFESWRVP